MRWLIPVRASVTCFVTVEAETEREAVQKLKDNDWVEQTDFDVVKVTKTGRPTLTPGPKRERKAAAKFDFGQRVRYKDGRRGTVVDGAHQGGVLVRFDAEYSDAVVPARDLAGVKPEHESEPDVH